MRVEGCEALEEEPISFSREISMEDDEEDEVEENSRAMGSWEKLQFTESEEIEDKVSIGKG